MALRKSVSHRIKAFYMHYDILNLTNKEASGGGKMGNNKCRGEKYRKELKRVQMYE